MKDFVVLIDENNRPLGQMEKFQAHNSNTPLHRGFSVFLFNKKGELLLQQRSSYKKTWPLVWSNSVCGHPMLNETEVEAGRRRLIFELGLENIELHVILPHYRYKYEHKGIVENEICPVMIGFTEELPVINSEEVANIKYILWENFLLEISKPNYFSEWCVEEALLLNDNMTFKNLFSSYILSA